MTVKLVDALRKLDPGNDSHWTSDGMPRLETVKLFAADAALTRDVVTAAAPGFSRTNPEPLGVAKAPPDEPMTRASVDAALAALPADYKDPDFVVTGMRSHFGALFTDADEAKVRELVKSGDGDDQEDGLGDGRNDDQQPQSETANGEDPLQATRARLEEAVAAKAKADKELAQAVAANDAAIDAAQRAGPAETFQDHLQAYFARQGEHLAARAAQKQRIKDAGVNLKDLMPTKAPIDQAMLRKNTRGTQRPNLPLKK